MASHDAMRTRAVVGALLLAATSICGHASQEPRQLRTLLHSAPHDAGTFGGIQYLSLPIGASPNGSQPCQPSVMHAFAKCLLTAEGAQHWRMAAAFARTTFPSPLGPPPEALAAFGPPCGPVRATLRPLPHQSTKGQPADAAQTMGGRRLAAAAAAAPAPIDFPVVEPGGAG